MYLTDKDIPLVPLQVTFSHDQLIDLKLGKQYPINEISYNMLVRIDNKKSIGEIATEISSLYGISFEQALDDMKAFFFELCKAHLINIKHNSYLDNLKLFFVNLLTFNFKMAIEALTERKRYDFPTGKNNVLSTLFFLALYILVVFKFNLIALFILLNFIPTWGWYEAGYMTLAFYLSIVVHECSHMVMLYATSEEGKVGFLGRSYGTIGIFRNYTTPRNEIFVSLIGPMIPFFIGVETFILGLIHEDSLLVFTSFFSDDGKNLRRGIQDLIKERRAAL